jgi:mRNA turnover protein 4
LILPLSVALTRTRKKGLESKKKLIDELRNCLEEYDKVFVFSVRDMRNAKLKDVRAKFRTSRYQLPIILNRG